MKISDFQKKYQHTSGKGLSYCILKELEDTAYFDFDVYLPTKGKNLQRGLVWTDIQKNALIFTILRGQKIPPFTVVQQSESGRKRDYTQKFKWQVIDGKQRITTILAFFNGEFAIEHQGAKYFYADLPLDVKRAFDGYSLLTVDVHYDYDGIITDQVKIDLFEEINFLGTPQDIAHLNDLKS